MKAYFERYWQLLRPHAPALFFFCGFVWDTLTLTRIDLWYENFVFISYLVMAAGGIVLTQAYWGGRVRHELLDRHRLLLPLLVQFPLGGLFSGFVIFYTQSASLFTSWPFLLLLLGIFIGNETFKKRYEKLVFQMSVYFIALFSYLIFIVPVVVSNMGPWVFLASGALSLIVIACFAWALFAASPDVFRSSMAPLMVSVGGIFLIFNIFYFTNIIPPIPLALKHLDIYHRVERTEGGYRLLGDARPWYDLTHYFTREVHLMPNEPLYAFGAVFAPTRLSGTIVHRWEYENTEGNWQTVSTVSYPIRGGRDEGYRGYSIKERLTPGKWRVSVETERGQVLGRRMFWVMPPESSRELRWQEQ